MRNVKRLLVLALALLMVCSVAVFSASATKTADYSEAAKRLSSLNILKGDGTGNLMLDSDVTRWHAALFFVQALTGKTEASYWNGQKESEYFSDVPEYGTAIDYACAMGLIKGRGNGVYGYADQITYQDMLVMAVRALGYETPEMPSGYPQSYLVAAGKLGLTANIADDVTNKQPLKRGETAQIIWDMLNTEIAVTDPVSGKLLYPDVKTDALGSLLTRKTLLEDAGYSRDEIRGTLTKFVEGKTSADPDVVTLSVTLTDANKETYVATVELNAADLGMNERTVKDTYLGMPVTLYVNCKAEEFITTYDYEDEECEAKILFHELSSTTTVKCLGDGTIKYTGDKTKTLTLGSEKFSMEKYDLHAFELTEKGWKEMTKAVDFCQLYEYDTSKKVYTDDSAPYGEVRYMVLDKNTWGLAKDALYVYSMPYSYGRLVTRSTTYRPTASAATFTLIAQFEADRSGYYPLGSTTTSQWVEHFLGSDAILANATYVSVSELDGKASMTVKLAGDSAKSNDMVMYFYNEADNILHIGKSYGPYKTGRLTATSPSKETVKIDGVEYGVGFAGGFTAGFPSEYKDFSSSIPKWIAEQDANKNVYYFVVGENVVRLVHYSATTTAVQHDYAIITTDPTVMAKALNLTAEKYEKALVDGWYLKDGKPQVAMLNKTTGAWQLATVGAYEYGTYDVEENEFATTVDLIGSIEMVDLYGDSFKKYSSYCDARDAVQNGGLFMIRKNASGVYTLSLPEIKEGDKKNSCMDRWYTTEGLVFSDTAAKTNLIKSDSDTAVKTARVTMTSSSIIVVIDRDGNVGVRKGIQKAAKSLKNVHGYFYSATAKLIVFQAADDFDVAAWATGASMSTDEVYYMTLGDYTVTSERLDSGDWEVTLENLYNFKTLKKVPSLKITIEDSNTASAEAKAYSDIQPGAVLHMTEEGKLMEVTMSNDELLYRAMEIREPNGYTAYSTVSQKAFAGIVWNDGDAITLPTKNLDDALLNSMSVSVVTLDLTGLDRNQYDYNRIILADVEYDDDTDWDTSVVKMDADGTKAYIFPIEGINDRVTIKEPTRGALDMYMLENMDGTFLIPDVDDDYYENAKAVTMSLSGQVRIDSSENLIMYILRTITLVED